MEATPNRITKNQIHLHEPQTASFVRSNLNVLGADGVQTPLSINRSNFDLNSIKMEAQTANKPKIEKNEQIRY